MLSINLFALFFLMTFISQVTRAYVGLAYPNVAETTVSLLVTIPNLTAMIFAFLIGPFSVGKNKVNLLSTALIAMILHCVLFYINGRMHGPFFIYLIAGACGGYGIGTYIPLINSIISDHFPSDQRSKRIANYNVFINIGGMILLQLSGVVAARNNGAQWYNAYLFGILAVAGLASFLFVAKRAHIEVPSITDTASGTESAKVSLRDMPAKVLGWITLMGVVHCLFYVTQYAFNINVSNYIITEYKLGTSVQAGTATSMVRLILIVITALYPFLASRLKGFMIPLGYLSVGIGLFVMMTSKSLFGAYACAFFVACGTSLAHSTVYGNVTRYVPVAMVPIATSLMQGLVSLGSFFSVYIITFFGNLLGGGMNGQFLAGIITSAVIAVAAVFMYVIKKPAYDASRTAEKE